MAKAKKREFSSGGFIRPDWKSIAPDMQVKTVGGIPRTYERMLWEAEFYVHHEVATKSICAEFLRYCATHFDKKKAATLKKISEHHYLAAGKYAYMANKGVVLTDAIKTRVEEEFNRCVNLALEVLEEEPEEAKSKAPVISIQDRMREQMEPLMGDLEAVLDDWMRGENISKVDPYKMMASFEPEVKAAHAKIVRDHFATAFAEAREVAEWKDEDIKEAFSYTTAAQRKEYLAFFERLDRACDTVAGEQKATRKPRKKKPVAKDKLVEKLKYKDSESTIGVASINPVDVLDAKVLWIYNTKNRKLGVYVADEMLSGLGVKGTTITGFDPEKSLQKTIRKPAEQLTGISKLARTKLQKLFNEVNATETKLTGRLNEHTVLVKVF